MEEKERVKRELSNYLKEEYPETSPDAIDQFVNEVVEGLFKLKEKNLLYPHVPLLSAYKNIESIFCKWIGC